ncbi:DUF6491 family protein [Asticcacaulis sp. YBE204]|uniref:DUF6491 family protein n=1 Tax=Asticcacaulis sp. YBE204 TaxID=1282363 RepID=UPI0003C3BC4F|nr:DUF6491 family protein [Asticcacaulis sp. YBE204]ESQ80529.1 hypothetical protein AEYBE204_04480 [Asticcacaulis sp. YBE204]
MKTLLSLTAVAAAGLTALTLVPVQSQARAETPAQKEMKKCFRSDDIDRFNPVDSRTMIIETYAHQHYKLTLSGACMGIEEALRIGVKTRNGLSNVCGGLDAEILYNEMGSGRVTRCAVTEVTPITQEEADRIEGVEDRKTSKSNGNT